MRRISLQCQLGDLHWQDFHQQDFHLLDQLIRFTALSRRHCYGDFAHIHAIVSVVQLEKPKPQGERGAVCACLPPKVHDGTRRRPGAATCTDLPDSFPSQALSSLGRGAYEPSLLPTGIPSYAQPWTSDVGSSKKAAIKIPCAKRVGNHL
jgi:hypothetical protein